MVIKPCIKAIAILALCSIPLTAHAGEDGSGDVPDFVQQARDTVRVFQKALKQELVSALQSGGPTKAVAVCHRRAPEIAREISRQTGWKIGRTALKIRHQKNTPDDLARAVLIRFEERKQNGTAVEDLEWWQQSGNRVSYMKAIPMQGPCVQCHGTSVNPDLKQSISQLYPHDVATGFQLGDIRGAFIVTTSLDELGGKISE